MRDDLFGLLLDLPHPLEIADGVGVVFDAEAEQRADGSFQHAGEPIERLDLDDLAGLDPVDRGTRHPEPFGDLFGCEPAAHPVGAQPFTDFGKAVAYRAHFRLSPHSVSYLRQRRT